MADFTFGLHGAVWYLFFKKEVFVINDNDNYIDQLFAECEQYN